MPQAVEYTMLHLNGISYVEAEAYGNAKTRLKKNIRKRVRIGSVYPFVHIYIY